VKSKKIIFKTAIFLFLFFGNKTLFSMEYFPKIKRAKRAIVSWYLYLATDYEYLNDFCRLPHHIVTDKIFEFMDLKTLRSMGKANRELHMLYRKYFDTTIKNSTKVTSLRMRVEDPCFCEKIMHIKQVMKRFIKNSDRRLKIKMYSSYCEIRQKVIVGKDNIDQLEERAKETKRLLLQEDKEMTQYAVNSFGIIDALSEIFE